MKYTSVLIIACLCLFSCTTPAENKSKEDPTPKVLTDACECLNLIIKVSEEMDNPNNTLSQKEIKNKYQSEISNCDSIMKEYAKGYAGLSPFEHKERERQMESICPAYNNI